MRSRSATFATDRQRLLVLPGTRATLGRPPLPKPAANDKARLASAAVRRTPKPLNFSSNTFVIRGKDDTYVGFSFGEGKGHELNLYDYLPAERVPRLSNYILKLTGVIPDAIGIDLGGSVGVSVYSALVGVNVLWHTRGEHTGWPELHLYHGYSGGFTWGGAFKSLFTPPNGSVAVQLILGWAFEYGKTGKRRPASNQWVANGYNWTGTFWSVGFSVPIPPRFTAVGSYFQSIPIGTPYPFKSTRVWSGISLGMGMSAKTKLETPFIELDTTKLLSFKNPGLNVSRTEYSMEYGNGDDFMPSTGKDISGWHRWDPINQNDYPAPPDPAF